MPEVSEKSKGIFSKMASLFRGKEQADSIGQNSSSTEILSGIYKLLVDKEKRNVDDHKEKDKKQQQEESELEKRHKEVLKALTVKRVTKRKVKETEKVVEEKPSTKTPKTETPKTETPKTGETPAAKTEPPKVETPTPKTETPATKVETPTPKVETPKPTATPAPAKPTPVTPQPVPPQPVIPKPTAAKLPSGSKVVGAGLLAAAAMSVRGETGEASLEKVGSNAKKVGQVVDNDPKPGVSSYGIFGINSGGSVQKFVADNPQFELVGTPGSKEFSDSWKKVAAERTKEFYDAQISWYDKYVYQPTKRDLAKMLTGDLAYSDKIATYMADRRNQMGQLYEKQAIDYAKDSKSPEEFIVKIAEHDSTDEFIRKAFPTYLKTHGDKNIPGLKNRVELRKKLSMAVSIDAEKMNTTSAENADMKKSLQEQSTTPQNVTNNISVNTPQEQQQKQGKVDDRSAFDRKRTE